MPSPQMYRVRIRILSALVVVWSLFFAGCIVGVHHHQVGSTVHADDHTASVDGSVSGVDLGVMADFRYVRVGMPFEGQRHQLAVDVDGEGGFEIDQVFEMRSLQLDVPLYSFRDFDDEPSGRWYPGNMPQRHSLELWVGGSVGVTPLHSSTATLSLAYYRYGGIAARLYGGVSFTSYTGLVGADSGSGQVRREGFAPGAVVGLEVTLAAGEYALELIEYIIEWDRTASEVGGRRR